MSARAYGKGILTLNLWKTGELWTTSRRANDLLRPQGE
jgi:hypothetical protein